MSIAKSLRVLLIALTYVLASAVTLNIFMTKWGFRDDHPHFGFQHFMEHTVSKPFCYRWLVPATAATIAAHTPPSVQTGITGTLNFRDFTSRYRLIDRYGVEKFIVYVMMFLSLVLFAVLLRALSRAVLTVSRPLDDFGPAIALLLLPLSFHQGGYFYDFPELMFAAACCLAIVRRRYLGYYVLFVLAIFNKETGLLLVLYFATYFYGKLPRRTWLTHVAAQGLVGGGIVALTRLRFAAYPDQEAWSNLGMNLAFLFSTEPWLARDYLYSVFVPSPAPLNVLSLGLVIGLLLYDLRDKPRDVRVMFFSMTGVLLPLFLVFGYKDELRNFSLAYPIAYLMCLHTVDRLYRPVSPS